MNVIKTFGSLEAEKRRNLLLLLVTGLLFWSSITTLLPTLPIYLEDIGGTTAEIGLVMGSFALGLIASRTWLGHLADSHSRKLVVQIGALVAGIAPLGYLSIQSIFPLMAVRAFNGVSLAAFTTGYSALVVDLSPVAQRGELIGYMSLVAPIGMAIGPVLGAFLQESQGYPPLFLTAAGLGFLAYFLTATITEQSRQKKDNSQANVPETPHRNLRQLLASRSLLIPSLILWLIGLVFGTLFAFLPLFLRETSLGFNAGLFYLTAAIASFASRIFSGQASDHYGRGLFITLSLLFYAVSMALLNQADTTQELFMAAIVEGSASGMSIPMIVALISDRSSSSERGKVYSVCLGGFDLGMVMASPIFGILGEIIDYRSMFALAGSLAMIAMLLFLCQSNKSFKQSLRFALGRGKDVYALEYRI
ncbi:MAG TPA: MFS transporter [Cyanothece sp. UBA12306]|nr:MFS transporter [Cyanothece sp. UBA12306]